MSEEEIYYTIKDVTEKFGITRTTVYEWMDSGLEYVYVGGRRRVTKSALDRFIQSRTQDRERAQKNGTARLDPVLV